MTPVDWPDGVPSCFQPQSAQGGYRDNRYSFETDSKITPIERPASSWTPEVYSGSLSPMTVSQFEAFQAWFTGDLAFGTVPFNFDHPITGTPGIWRIVKADPPYRVSKVGRIPSGSNARRIELQFSIMSWPGEVSS